MIPNDFQDAFMAKIEKERTALEALFPSERDLKSRIPIITTVKGTPADIYDLSGAHSEWEILTAMEEHRKINWSKIDPVEFLTKYGMSIGGRHADRAVEIARAAPQQSIEQTFWERLVGKGKE